MPEETFKPNKINVRASILLLKRREHDDVDLDDKYDVTFVDMESLGYEPSGEAIRGFDFEALLHDLEKKIFDVSLGSPRAGDHWRAFEVPVDNIRDADAFRLDLKYWEPETCEKIQKLHSDGAATLKSLNKIPTRRGRSPSADSYVDEKDGFAFVVKAGSNITKFGELLVEGDFIEKSVYDEMSDVHLQQGDVLIASTGTGTLGKACVYNSNWPAIADGHVTIVRVDSKQIDPYYLADYIRVGGGAI